jgi:hypothetical protein
MLGALLNVGVPGTLAAALLVGGVEDSAGAVERAGHEVAVDLVSDFDVWPPPGGAAAVSADS